jgi:hypothetical protein
MDHVGPHGLDEPGVLMQITDVVSPSGFMWRHPAWLIIGLLAAALAVTVPLEQHRIRAAGALSDGCCRQ